MPYKIEARVDLPPVFGNVSHTRQKTAGDRAEGLMRKIRGRTDRAAFPGANTTMYKPPGTASQLSGIY
ncbi:Hypp1235 [Branchiostoma lanceolatum]|uniref:Hypp1235 protein n=1 Tax=Branchiostoma lanceolatum TaxID=7740 RepID=A0A8J9ZFN2_BRALA|nr:Hypp1235 [Branchiostoma lanceolatum]